MFYDALVNVNHYKDVRRLSSTLCDDCGTECGLTTPTHWVIVAEDPDDPLGWVFWSNESGWGARPEASVFPTDEVEASSLPQGSFGWIPAGWKP